VICDRFSDSTRAYQWAAGADEDVIQCVERIAVNDHMPDLTLVLDLARPEAEKRLAGRGSEPDAIERRGDDYHERVRMAFLRIARENPERCFVIDASLAPDKILGQALAEVRRRLAGTM